MRYCLIIVTVILVAPSLMAQAPWIACPSQPSGSTCTIGKVGLGFTGLTTTPPPDLPVYFLTVAPHSGWITHLLNLRTDLDSGRSLNVIYEPTLKVFEINTNANNGIALTGGNVGIGDFPISSARLYVAGDINVSGNINAKYRDVAEWVDTTEQLAPGTLVVLHHALSDHVTASTRSYDTTVAGVVSPRPGIALGEAGPNKALIATTGRVKLKVDATKNPIRIGDLLTTSDLPGHAMKSILVDVSGVQLHRPGTIIGKALEPLPSGRGEILALLTLQ